MKTIELDLSELSAWNLKRVHRVFLFIAKHDLACPALVTITRQIAWLALDEMDRRRKGEMPRAGELDLSQAIELPPEERRGILGFLKDVVRLRAGGCWCWPWQYKAFRASLQVLEAALAESEELAEVRALAQPPEVV